ncbi:DUF397 domain-containing protein [Actinosynnema sp. NPDC051121]
MSSSPLEGARWVKSSRSGSNGGECVEVAKVGNSSGIRDSKNSDGPVLHFPTNRLDAFLEALRKHV